MMRLPFFVFMQAESLAETNILYEAAGKRSGPSTQLLTADLPWRYIGGLQDIFPGTCREGSVMVTGNP